jgi:CHAD domain-containing protein
METELALGVPSRPCSAAQAARRIFAGLAGEFPVLDISNLHAFRKRLKPALYLAEISAATDAQAAELATAFGEIHDSTGAWHDWQALAEEASCVLPRYTRQNGLVPVLETMAEEALQKALDLCRRSETRLLENIVEIQPSQRRKPVASEADRQPGEDARLASLSA